MLSDVIKIINIIVMVMIVHDFFLQLKFYVRSERRLGRGRDLSEAYFALDGQFVSNWKELKSTAGMSNVFPKSDIELIPQGFLVLQYCCIPTAILLSVLLAIKICGNKTLLYRCSVSLLDPKTQKPPFIIGFILCFAFFEFAIIVAELWSMNLLNPDHVIVKHIILVIICGVLFLPCLGCLPCLGYLPFACCQSEYKFIKSFFFIYVVLFYPMFAFNLLFCVWLIINLLATILLGIAYPLYTLSLFMIHVAFMYVGIVSLAVGIASESISSVQKESDEVQKNSGGKCNCKICFCISCLIVLILFHCLVYVAIIFGYVFTVVQGFVDTDAPHAVVLLLPSMVTFFIGWLIKKNFFGACKWQNVE